MPYQQKSARQQQKLSRSGMNEDGLVELNEDVLEIIVGGKGAMAQDQIVQAEIATLEKNQSSSSVTIVNYMPSTNTGSSRASNGNITHK